MPHKSKEISRGRAASIKGSFSFSFPFSFTLWDLNVFSLICNFPFPFPLHFLLTFWITFLRGCRFHFLLILPANPLDFIQSDSFLRSWVVGSEPSVVLLKVPELCLESTQFVYHTILPGLKGRGQKGKGHGWPCLIGVISPTRRPAP